MTDRARILPVASLLLAMLLWASSFVALKLAFRGLDPMAVIFGRMAVAGLCFLFVAPRFRQVEWRRGDLRAVLLMALCEPCLYFLFEAQALANTTASQAGVICSFFPLLVAIGAAAALGERLTRRTVTGFLLAIAGACWLSLAGDATADAPNPALGNFYEFLAMVCGAGYTILMKRLSSRIPPFLLTGLQAWVGTVFYLPLLFLPSTVLAVPTLPAALAVVYLGIAVTLGAYGCFNYGVSRVPASQASAFVNLIPVFGVVLGWVVLGETFSPGQWAACALVLGGVLLSQERWRSRVAVDAAG